MTTALQEAINLKRDIEGAVSKLLQDFTAKTQLTVQDMDLNILDVSCIGHDGKKVKDHLYTVQLDIRVDGWSF